MKLTENANIDALPYAGKEPCIYWGKRGFGVRVYASGTKKYILCYRSSGRKRLLTLGEYPSLSRDTAEDMAASYRLLVSEGGDPVLEKRLAVSAAARMPKPQITANKTVGALCDAYLSLHASKKRSGYSDERLIERFVRPPWGKLRADAVSRAHVAILHTHVSKATPGQANRLLAIIKTMWKKATIWGYVAENYANPAVGVTMNKEFPRERFIQPSELPRFISAVEQESDIRIRGALWLFLLTGRGRAKFWRQDGRTLTANAANFESPNQSRESLTFTHSRPAPCRCWSSCRGSPETRT